MTHRLDLSIGPVQGFIASSRRTRDLWGSSYLLAFLTAHALRGVEEAGGRIVQPLVDDDPLYRWVSGERDGRPPSMGSLPNHFVAELSGRDAGAIARAGCHSMRRAWKRVCDALWNRFVADAAALGKDTAKIWKRQTESFWDVTWTVGFRHPSSGLPLLARRKQWRTHRLPTEPGDKCTVMSDFQELSGFVRSTSREDGERQKAFWDWLRQQLGGPVNLRENERLCAVALAKRMFTEVGEQALGWSVDATRWPSTVYVAAVPWIRVAAATAPQQAAEYAERVKASAPESMGPPWVFRPLRGAHEVGRFPGLDANWLHADFVQDDERSPIEGENAESVRTRLLEALRSLRKSLGASGAMGAPSSFYAILLADGDGLGRLVSDPAIGGEVVSRSLARFTEHIGDLVRKHDGVAVYAGGDDVLGIFPVKSALECAEALRESYRDAFLAELGSENRLTSATLSAAIVFAQIRFPLGQAIEAVHRLLDDVAKDGNGRNSLAASVLKPNGLHCEWATTWCRRGPSSDPSSPNSAQRAIGQLDALARHIAKIESEPGISSGLLYRLRDTLSLLCGWDSWKPGKWGTLPKGLNLKDFVRAEVFHSLSKRTDEERERADDLTDLLCDLLWRSCRRTNGREHEPRHREIGLDALMLARFLALPREE